MIAGTGVASRNQPAKLDGRRRQPASPNQSANGTRRAPRLPDAARQNPSEIWPPPERIAGSRRGLADLPLYGAE